MSGTRSNSGREGESGPGSYFGSKEYNEGKLFSHDGYEYIDGLRMVTGAGKDIITMWSLAFDVREDCPPGQDLRDGDFVLFHYTDEKSFEQITKLSGGELRASFRVEDNKDSYFGHGIYATLKAPHQWPSKDHFLVNSFWPAKKIFQDEYPDEPFPDDSDIESLVQDKDGAAFQRLQKKFGKQWEYCIPLIVDQQVAKNVMTEPTKARLMPKDEDGKRRKRLAGYNRFGEKQPSWRDVWIISVYDAKELVGSQPKPKNATQSVEAIAEILHRRWSDSKTTCMIMSGHKGPEFRDLLMNLLEKMDEKKENYWLYTNLASSLEQGDAVPIKGESWDARKLREKAVQLNSKDAYLRLAHEAKRLNRKHAHARLKIGQEALDETQLWLRTIEESPGLCVAYVNLAVSMYPADHPDPHKVVQLFGEAWDWKRLMARGMALGAPAFVVRPLLAERLHP
eukprot:Skav228096  [mRNA]  locus=scaffold4074:13396:14751:+ [translate_table: standard]